MYKIKPPVWHIECDRLLEIYLAFPPHTRVGVTSTRWKHVIHVNDQLFRTLSRKVAQEIIANPLKACQNFERATWFPIWRKMHCPTWDWLNPRELEDLWLEVAAYFGCETRPLYWRYVGNMTVPIIVNSSSTIDSKKPLKRGR